jgi:hypothetical protein
MRRAAKVDANHGAIVDALRRAGATVQSLAGVGKGCPDLLVGHRGRNWLMEVKDPAKPPSARELTPDQKVWTVTWGGQVAVVETIEDALAVVGLINRGRK